MRARPWLLPTAVAVGIAAALAALGVGWKGAAGVGSSVGLLSGLGELLRSARDRVVRR